MIVMDQQEEDGGGLMPTRADRGEAPGSASTTREDDPIRGEIFAILMAEQGGLGDVWR
jgi:hypothetical protein